MKDLGLEAWQAGVQTLHWLHDHESMRVMSIACVRNRTAEEVQGGTRRGTH